MPERTFDDLGTHSPFPERALGSRVLPDDLKNPLE